MKIFGGGFEGGKEHIKNINMCLRGGWNGKMTKNINYVWEEGVVRGFLKLIKVN